MTVVVERHGHTRVLRVDRASARNALDSATMTALVRAANECAQDDHARVLVLAASGPTFIAGGDLREFGALKGRSGGRAVARKGHALIDGLRSAGLPLVAAIDGDAFGGGCELAAACDLRIAHRLARFHWVQNKLAVTTGWGATARLVALVGAGTAAQWLLSAQTVTAEEAHARGFVDHLADEDSALASALAWSERVAAIDPTVTRLQLSLLRGPDTDRRARAAESRAFAECWALPAHEAAIDAFVNARGRRARSTTPDP
jgi:enoyl-CoA hydratase/carnithine racemase